MIDNQENNMQPEGMPAGEAPAGNRPAEETAPSAESALKTEAEEQAASENAVPETAVEDGFSQPAPSVSPEPAEPEVPTVEEVPYQAQEVPTVPEVPSEQQPPVQETVPQGVPAQEIPPVQAAYGSPQQPGYAQPMQQPFYGWQPAAPQQPYYGQPIPPQQPVPQPGYYGGYYGQQPVAQPPVPPVVQPGYPVYQEPPRPPKKKMSTGLKVFIWIASLLAGAAILGSVGYLTYTAVNAPKTNFPFGGGLPYSTPAPQFPFGGGDEDDDIPDFDDGVVPPDADKDDHAPDVDVTPNTEGIMIHKQPGGAEKTAQEVYQKVVKSTVTVASTYNQKGSERNSTGTGIIATSDGYIITNSHVVMNSKSSVVEITTYDGNKYEAVVVGVDRTTDLAILKTNDHDFTPAEFGDAEELEIGDSVVAIGNPGGAAFSGSMTGGYISGLNRSVGRYSENGMTYIQTDAAINPGNSGGPLVNMYGQVVGINSSKIITDGYEGMGFAIPVSKAQSIINELLSGGYVKGRTRLGIVGSDVTSSMAMLYNVPQGFVISEIAEESAFTGTEAQAGDIIIAIDGEAVSGLTDISNLLLKYAPGDRPTITLYRQNGTELDVTVTLLEDKGETQK